MINNDCGIGPYKHIGSACFTGLGLVKVVLFFGNVKTIILLLMVRVDLKIKGENVDEIGDEI